MIFFQNRIEYCGFAIDKNGIHKTKHNIDAIENMKPPQNKDEVKANVGLINYYGRFFKNLSTILFPINILLKVKVKYIWDRNCQSAFDNIKCEMQSK